MGPWLWCSLRHGPKLPQSPDSNKARSPQNGFHGKTSLSGEDGSSMTTLLTLGCAKVK